MIRALWDCIYGHCIPNFKEAPFDLGSFEDIVHRQNDRKGLAATFNAEVQIGDGLEAKFEFGEENTIPVPIKICFGDNGAWIEEFQDSEGNSRISFKTLRGNWEVPKAVDIPGSLMLLWTSRQLLPTAIPEIFIPGHMGEITLTPLGDSPEFSDEDSELMRGFRLLGTSFDSARPIARKLPTARMSFKLLQAGVFFNAKRPFASAPVRSQPQRTYDPATLISDPEGNNIPMFLARLAYDKDEVWANFKKGLERFGANAGIFDEIDVKHLKKSSGAPFQVQVRKPGKHRKGPRQNLIDVGYGISQVLPILTELLTPGISRMALLQQPEVHLHPSAQAALGSLFCEVAGQGRQLVVETHSDHLMDRIRMDVRDGKTNLKPEDVSILFFERNDLSVHIHSIRLDKEGNVLNEPVNYRKFFMEETRRSLWS